MTDEVVGLAADGVLRVAGMWLWVTLTDGAAFGLLGLLPSVAGGAAVGQLVGSWWRKRR